MSTNAPHAPGEFGEPPVRTGTATGSGRGPGYYARKVLKALASLQLTVVLFGFGILLVFFGTLAQIDNGIWTVVEHYFAANFDSVGSFVESLVVMIPFELIRKFLAVFWKESFPPAPAGSEAVWSGSFPFPNGFLIGIVMFVNLLAAHATRFRLSWKRIGVFLIHIGIALLLIGEFITRIGAVEQQMTIPQGSAANFTENTREVELAVIDRSDPKDDRVTVITRSAWPRLARASRITHPDLPVDVEVLRYMKNANFKDPGPRVENPATTGAGLEVVAVEAKEESGVETKQRGDIASAYVRLYKKGTNEPLGTHLVSLLLSLQNHSDTVTVDGKPYQMTLRRARIYKPYTVHLDQFRFDRYEGTGKARNYSSDVRVFDADGNEVRKTKIAMNEPMRYAGETFYQSSFDKAETTTILQVVKNPGMLSFFGLFYFSIDYLACALVGIGLVTHFGIYLTRFLIRRSPSGTSSAGSCFFALPVAVARRTSGADSAHRRLRLLSSRRRGRPRRASSRG